MLAARMHPRMSDVTQILERVEAGYPRAAAELLPLVYEELHKLAAARMATERPDHTLQATALVHEAYMRLVDNEKLLHWRSRGHFFSAAAEAMRRILIESARRKRSLKGGGQVQRASLDVESLAEPGERYVDDLLDLNASLDRLAEIDSQAAELVKLRLFAGLTIAEAARYAGIPKSTAYDAWAFVRAWFAREFKADSPG